MKEMKWLLARKRVESRTKIEIEYAIPLRLFSDIMKSYFL